MSLPYRLYLRFQNENDSLRVQAHKTDETLLVIKTRHPEAVDNLALLAGTSIGAVQAFSGKKYRITFVKKDEFLKAVPAFLEKIALVTPQGVEDPDDEHSQEATSTEESEEPGEDDPDEASDDSDSDDSENVD